MKLIEVVAVEDRSRAEGGHAVILLRGVEHAKPGVTFSLKQIAEERDGDEETETPLAGLTDLRALEVTMTADGMALSVGPEIAESALFVPGAAVEITLPELGVRGEFLWPAITPHVRPKRRNIMIRRTAADSLPRPAAANEGSAVAEPEAIVPASAPAVATSAIVPEVELVPASVTPLDLAPAVLAEPSTVPPEPQPQPAARRPIVLRSSLPRRPVAEPVARLADDEGPAGVIAGQPAGDVRVAAVAVSMPDTSSSAPAKETAAPAAPAAATEQEELRGSPARSNLNTEASVPPSPERGGRTISTGSAVALAAATLLAGQVIAFRALNLSVVPRQTVGTVDTAPSVAAVATPKAEPAPAPKQVPAPPSPPQRSVYEVIWAGPQSPRGVAAADVSPAKALQLAHALLHGNDSERDPEEAAYWLKHYLASASGGDPIRIALTQLGSAYAQPVQGQRDFASARIVWELSSALGDPVAMCFIGAMHEHGLGIYQSSRIAKAWYDRAADLGRVCAQAPQGAAGEAR